MAAPSVAALRCALFHSAHSNGFCVCPNFIGHGIGSYFHGHPEIWHHANDNDLLMEEGMSFTIEPILMEGTSEFKILSDKWTAISVDDKRLQKVCSGKSRVAAHGTPSPALPSLPLPVSALRAKLRRAHTPPRTAFLPQTQTSTHTLAPYSRT
ncbi:Methionine aminopeptidase 1D, mitochondrial [Bagarius yarrelli]|uniref:Methionine aminopeptidase 1D, mitochondrial n=1 Tax=Bagarius yarrelli TaxID=175774 RepID=A0A556TKU7_BAGYA|nr:Methionine aminopeptidase 1D, mitochondrial [Bagarius yarrelli]